MTPRILIVDDEPQIREVLRRKLEKCGYTVEEAIHGKDAIEKLDASAFELVIADIVMPERDGLEVIMYLKKRQPSVKIIAVSAPSNELFLRSASGLGADRVFPKPFQLADIADAVAELFPT